MENTSKNVFSALYKAENMFDGNIFHPPNGTVRPIWRMGVSVPREDGRSVVRPFYTGTTTRYELRNAATYVERCETR